MYKLVDCVWRANIHGEAILNDPQCSKHSLSSEKINISSERQDLRLEVQVLISQFSYHGVLLLGYGTEILQVTRHAFHLKYDIVMLFRYSDYNKIISIKLLSLELLSPELNKLRWNKT